MSKGSFRDANRKVDIVELKRRHRAYDPIPAEFGFGVTIEILEAYKPGRFTDLKNAVRERDRMFNKGETYGKEET